jgi:hypothetical protein
MRARRIALGPCVIAVAATCGVRQSWLHPHLVEINHGDLAARVRQPDASRCSADMLRTSQDMRPSSILDVRFLCTAVVGAWNLGP